MGDWRRSKERSATPSPTFHLILRVIGSRSGARCMPCRGDYAAGGFLGPSDLPTVMRKALIWFIKGTLKFATDDIRKHSAIQIQIAYKA